MRALAGLLLVLGTGTAMAGGFNLTGDGSHTDNADLPGDPATVCDACLTAPPHEWDAPPFDVDWSVSLRGAYVRDQNGAHVEAITIPQVSLRHDFLRGTYTFDGVAELVKSTTEDFRVGLLRLGTAGEYQINFETSFSGSANFVLSQADASTSGYPTDTISASQELAGDATGEITREFGLFSVGLRGAASRSTFGPTTLADGTQIDNSHNNNWRAGAGLRLGFRMTPLLTAFVDSGADFQTYDVPAPDLGVKLDAIDYAVRAGIAAGRDERLEAEFSAGLALRRFTEANYPDVVSQLYDASLIYRPDETLIVHGALTTTIGAPGPNSSGGARVEYAALGDIGYQINPWIRLRASAGAHYAVFVGNSDTETGYGAGVGADYLINENLTATADYSYRTTTTTPSPPDEEHRLTLGMTLRR